MGRIWHIILVLIFLLGSSESDAQKADSFNHDLCAVFDQGYILMDTNGDSVCDYVNTQIVLPNQPSETHIVCAANIVARLGYETSGIDLDLVEKVENNFISYSKPIIAIAVFSDSGVSDLHQTYPLTPGQGRIRFFVPTSLNGELCW